jgi:hypothetical protein
MNGENRPTGTDETAAALDHPVVVPVYDYRDGPAIRRGVKPSDVVAAHNAQTEDPVSRLTTMGEWDKCMRLMRERDLAWAERDEARDEAERLRDALMEIAGGTLRPAHLVARLALDA